MTVRRRSSWAAVLTALTLVFSGPGLQAAAAEGDSVVTFQQAAQEVEYGSSWSFYATATNTYQANGPWTATATVTGTTPLVLYSYNEDGTYTTYVTVLAAQGQRPLPVGDYGVIVTVADVFGNSHSSPTGTLAIVPAQLGIDVVLTEDPAAPGNSILSARFTGQFADNLAPAEYSDSAQAPAGTWHLTIEDAQGKTVLDETVDRPAGGNNLATSLYWKGATPGEVYTPRATFTAAGSTAENFIIAPGKGSAFTASTAERPVPTPSATASSPVPIPESAGSRAELMLPLWLTVAAGGVLAGLAALLVVVIVRRRTPPSPATAIGPETRP